MIKLILLICALSTAPKHKDRELIFSKMLETSASYEQTAYLYFYNRKDPEVAIRLKELAKFKWDVETADKYSNGSSYVETREYYKELQDKDFKLDFNRRVKAWSAQQDN